LAEEFNGDILKAKESKFEEFVELASKTYDLNYKPKVVFLDGYIPENPSWLACIDIASWTIYVSRKHLKEMPDEQIKETAFHEVTHLFNASHDMDFRNKLDDVTTGTWKPPPGVIAIDGNIRRDEPRDTKKKTKQKPDKIHCNLCGTKSELKKCPYCSRYFCEEHFAPLPPSMPNFDYPSKFNEWKNRGENHHPCPNYYDFLVEEEKERRRKYRKALDSMSGKRRFKYREIPKIPIEESNGDKDGLSDEGDIIIQTKEPKPPKFKRKPKTERTKDRKPESIKTKYKRPLYKHPNKFIRWFFDKKHPYSKLRVNEFCIQLGLLLGFIVLFWLTFENNEMLNNIGLWIFQLGGIIQIILFILILRSLYKLLVNLRYGIRGLGNGYKIVGSFVAFILCAYLIVNANVISISVSEFDYGTFNPFEVDWEYFDNNSLFDIDIYDEGPTYGELTEGPKNITLTYIIDGNSFGFSFVVYKGLNDYLASLPREISYYTDPPTKKDFIMRDINQEDQKDFLIPLIDYIENITDNIDDQARIAVSIVQNIPYDWDGFYGSLTGKYPYEVLYTQSGVCGEKSELLVFILRELGFEVAVFEYELESHRAVGIKCPIEYSYDSTGYCFVETTSPSIITDSDNEYIGVGKLTSYSLIIISDGLSFNSVSEEYQDAKEFNRLNALAEASGGILSQGDYNRWLELVNKYGIEIG